MQTTVVDLKTPSPLRQFALELRQLRNEYNKLLFNLHRKIQTKKGPKGPRATAIMDIRARISVVHGELQYFVPLYRSLMALSQPNRHLSSSAYFAQYSFRYSKMQSRLGMAARTAAPALPFPDFAGLSLPSPYPGTDDASVQALFELAINAETQLLAKVKRAAKSRVKEATTPSTSVKTTDATSSLRVSLSTIAVMLSEHPEVCIEGSLVNLAWKEAINAISTAT